MIALIATLALSPAAAFSDGARFSLWEGQAAPVALAESGLEREAALAARSYDGLSIEPALKDALSAPLAAPASRTDGGMFVSVQLSLDPALGPLKDSLADLSSRSGFQPDARFAPMFLGARGDRAAVWGWLSPGRLGEALGVRGVERVEVSRSGAPAPREQTRGRYVLGIRLRAGDETPAPKLFARVTRELAETADFRWRRTIGYQSIPGSEDLALVILGDAPLRSLGAMMGHPDVVKMRPLADSAIPSSSEDGAALGKVLPGAAASKPGFLEFALERAPQLVGLTALLVFLSLRRRKRAI